MHLNINGGQSLLRIYLRSRWTILTSKVQGCQIDNEDGEGGHEACGEHR